MLKIALIMSTAMALSAPALAQGNSPDAPGQDRVCLITFNKAGTSANADVTSAKLLPRKAAEAQESDTMKIFEYGANGELTAEACECLDNASTRATCNQPVRG
jgi:hypothetical protein